MYLGSNYRLPRLLSRVQGAKNFHEDELPVYRCTVSGDRITPPLKSHGLRPSGTGPTPPILLGSPMVNNYLRPSWDDPPSTSFE